MAKGEIKYCELFTGWNEKQVISARLPTCFPLYFVAIAWAASSIKIRLCSSHILRIFSFSTACPVKSTATTAFVFSVIHFSMLSGSILYVLRLISANTGFAPTYRAQLADAANVIGVVMTSSPGPIPAAMQAQ